MALWDIKGKALGVPVWQLLGGAVRDRVPVPPAVRDHGVRMFHHFKARAPVLREGIAFRRPKLVIGWGVALTLIFAAIGGAGWLVRESGDQSVTTLIVSLAGLMSALGAAFVTAVVGLAAWLRKRGE